MANPRNQDSNNDNPEQGNGDDFDYSSSVSSGAETSAVGSGSVSRERGEIGLTERLTDVLVGQGDGDLLLQQNDREERVLQWLQALDLQVVGACRADERLKPLLKASASSGLAEDRLLAHLNQHFEPSEVGILARCFCIPLVSIRVGKINKQGTLLCPTATRGHLNLIMLPTSDLRLSFIGDDGNAERLFTLSSKLQHATVVVNEILADISGRSFCLKIPDDTVFYFWCAEKSKLLGIELLAKMKDILIRKPSIAELTGISKSRLDCFATHLRAYLVGSNIQENAACSFSSSFGTNLDPSEGASMLTKSIRARQMGSEAGKANSPYQGSLSPRSSSFKEGLPRGLSCLRNAAREKLRRRGDILVSAVDDLVVAMPHPKDASSSTQTGSKKLEEFVSSSTTQSSLLESSGTLPVPQTLCPASQVSSISSFFSPYYCWCPQGASTLQYPSTPLQLPSSSVESPLLPPLSSLISSTRSSSLLTPITPFHLADIPSLNFPALLPDTVTQLSRPTSQQFPTFTPLICDPIVHIPVIDVCSSGQGYLVSTGPTISSTIPPLNPKLVSPLIPQADSVVDKGARETLRLLISGSSQANPLFMDVLPAVVRHADEYQTLVAGSRGLYTGSRDVDAIANSIAKMNMSSLSGISLADADAGMCSSSGTSDSPRESLNILKNKPSDVSRSTLDEKGDSSNVREERID